MQGLLYGGLRVFLFLSFILPNFARSQDEPATKENVLQPQKSTSKRLSVEQAVRRFALRLDNEISFLLPEGEFDLAFEKRFGNFLTQTRAHYNFVRGELGFSLRNIYTRYRLVPQLQVYERLNFVPLFSRDRLWRREQGVQIGGRFFSRVPLATFTSYTYERLSFPSSINVQSLESQKVHAIAQGFSGKVDSLNFFGLKSSGLFELEIAKSLSFGASDFNYWQLRMSTQGRLERGRYSLDGRFRMVSLLARHSAPPQFLGGRDRLSGFDNNEFSGVNLVYGSLRQHLRLQKTPLPLVFNIFASEITYSTHLEVGQVGDERRVLDWRGYHASLGMGFDAVAWYRQTQAFQLFFFWYHGLESDRESRYFVGIKF